MSKLPETITRWWWVRHAPAAQTEGAFARRDARLSLRDPALFAPMRQTLPASAVWLCSPLARCRETCEALAPEGNVISEPRLAEQDFGGWEGRLYDDVWRENKDAWQQPELLKPPGGESYMDVCLRVRELLMETTRNHVGKDIVAITHAGVIRAAVGLASALPMTESLALTVFPLSLTVLHHRGERWEVEYVSRLASQTPAAPPPR